MPCADRVDNQFAGQFEFFQAAFLACHHDVVKVFAYWTAEAPTPVFGSVR